MNKDINNIFQLYKESSHPNPKHKPIFKVGDLVQIASNNSWDVGYNNKIGIISLVHTYSDMYPVYVVVDSKNERIGIDWFERELRFAVLNKLKDKKDREAALDLLDI